MEITVSNEMYGKLWDIMRKEGLETQFSQIEPAIGKLIEKYETEGKSPNKQNREYHNIHSADLMMPGSKGPKNLGLITRLLDTESWRRGEEMYYHTATMNSPGLEYVRKINKGYAKLLTSLTYSGYNPELSLIVAAGNSGGLGLLSGSHRVGYLLSLCENFLAPIKIFPTVFKVETKSDSKENKKTDTPANPYETFYAYGMPYEKVELIKNRYEKLVSKLNKTVLCFIKTASFTAKKDAVLTAFKSFGKCASVRIARAKMTKERRIEAVNDIDPIFSLGGVLLARFKFGRIYSA